MRKKTKFIMPTLLSLAATENVIRTIFTVPLAIKLPLWQFSCFVVVWRMTSRTLCPQKSSFICIESRACHRVWLMPGNERPQIIGPGQNGLQIYLIFSNAYHWQRIVVLWFKLHWHLFLRFRMMIRQHCFKELLGDSHLCLQYYLSYEDIDRTYNLALTEIAVEAENSPCTLKIHLVERHQRKQIFRRPSKQRLIFIIINSFQLYSCNKRHISTFALTRIFKFY